MSAVPLQLQGGWGQDAARFDAGAMSLEQLNGFLYDLQDQPQWRIRADIEADYYDSNQYDAKTLADMQAKGIPNVFVNLIAPTVNMVLGFEAKTRTDWLVRSETDEAEDEAAAMSMKLKEAERMSRADRACSDAYAGQIKVGLGWVHVGRNHLNPFGYRHRCESVHRREIWWDWHDEDPGLTRARYLLRRKWYDEDVAISYFPQFKELIYHAVRSWADFDPSQYQSSIPMYMDSTVERDFAWGDEEWRNTLRRRVCLYEFWYRTFRRGFVLRMPNGRVLEYNQSNPIHNAAITAGAAMPEPAIIPKMRMSWWMGPHRLVDIPTPYPHQEFPYVPFWGYREDRTGVPYGMIRSMKPMQDEVNARRARMLWQLSARRVIADQDAVLNHKAVASEVARPDAYIKLNPTRRNRDANAFRIEDNQSLTAQQYEIYSDAKRTLQDSAGVFMEQLGKLGAAQSGVAISQLIEQGTTTLAEINDNYRHARTLVGERLLSLVMHDMAGKPETVKVEVKGKKKRVTFNKKATDETTKQPYLENDTTRMQMRVVLDDVPSTPTFRAQQFMQLSEMMKGMPENLQAALVDIVIKASDVPQKEEVIDRVRKALGIQDTDPETMSDEERAQFEEMAADQKRMKELEDRLMEAQAKIAEADAKLKEANAELSQAKRDQILVESNIEPGLRRGAQEDVIEDTPGARMVAAAASEQDEDVPGADPASLGRARSPMRQGDQP